MADRVSQIRTRLGHPVIDSDGHYIEFLPLVKERLHALAGRGVAQAFENVVGSAGLARRMDADTQRRLGMVRIP